MSNKSRKKDGGDKMYSPIAGKDEADSRYKLKPTSKANVRDICRVMAERIFLKGSTRAQYADQAGIEPVRYEEKEIAGGDSQKIPIFELDDIWSEYYVHAAMAHALFWGFPKLVQAEYNEEEDRFDIEVLDPATFDALDVGVVNEAFLAFSQQQNGILNMLLANSNG